MFLQAKNLYKSFDDLNILSNINFSIEKGSVVSVVGKSGSGKTTLLNLISGFCKIDKGELLLDSININNLDANKRNISYVFQESPLFPNLNVLQNITINNNTYKKEKLDFLIKKSEINHILKSFPDELSGGEMQRVSVVRSLLRDPSLFLLDEPFCNLDQNTKKEVKNLVFEIINELKTTTLIVTHDVHDALEISDKIMVLENGVVNSLDTPFNTYNNPRSLHIANLFGDVNRIIIRDNEIFIRPENIYISEKSNKKAIVIRSFFTGDKYKIIALLNNQKIVFYSNKSYKKNSKLGIEIKKEGVLTFK